jgi:hypothetical protein
MRVFFAFLFLIMIASANSETTKKQKVMILFNGGDSTAGSPLDLSFASIEKSAVALYKKAGFDKVIVLSSPLPNDAKPTANNLLGEIRKLENVSDLHIGFISHGIGSAEASNMKLGGSYGMEGPAADNTAEYKAFLAKIKADHEEKERRFTTVPLTPREGKLYSAYSSVKLPYDRTRFSIASIETPDSSPGLNDVGMGELSEAILAAQKRNPDLQTTLYTGACFSGGMARSFADIPNVQTFVASQAVVYGWGIIDPEKKESDKKAPPILSGFEDFFQDSMMAGNSYIDAHDQATKKYLGIVSAQAAKNKKLTALISATVPRNGLQEHIINWCIKNKEIKAAVTNSNNCRQPEIIQRIRATNEITINYYKENPQIKSCHENAAYIAEIKEKKILIMAKAFKYVEEKVKSNANHDAVFQKIIEDSKVFYKSMVDQGETFDNSWLKELERKTPAQRAAHMRKQFVSTLEKLKADFNGCVKNQNSSYQSSCEVSKIASSTLIPFLSTWDSSAVSSKIEHHTEKLHKICAIKNVLDKENTLQQLDCLSKHSSLYPMEAFILSGRTAKFGSGCPVYLAAAESVQDDIQCLQNYEKFADCKSWSRLTELHTMGSRKLISKNENPQRESKNGEVVK